MQAMKQVDDIVEEQGLKGFFPLFGRDVVQDQNDTVLLGQAQGSGLYLVLTGVPFPMSAGGEQAFSRGESALIGLGGQDC